MADITLKTATTQEPVVETPEEELPITNKEMLMAVKKAIMAIMVGGQSYKIGSRTLTRADLKRLQNYEKELEAAVAEEDSADNGLFRDTYCALFDRR